MATYVYQDTDSCLTFEVQQSMKETAYTHRTNGFTHNGVELPGRWLRLAPEHVGIRARIADDDGSGHSAGRESAFPVKRLISASAGGFRLVSGPDDGHRQGAGWLRCPPRWGAASMYRLLAAVVVLNGRPVVSLSAVLEPRHEPKDSPTKPQLLQEG